MRETAWFVMCGLACGVAACGQSAGQGPRTTPHGESVMAPHRGQTTHEEAPVAPPPAPAPSPGASLARSLLESASSSDRFRIGDMVAMPAISRELADLARDGGIGAAAVALAREVDRVVLVTHGDAMGAVIVTQGSARDWAERVARLQRTTLRWSTDGRAHFAPRDEDGRADRDNTWELRATASTTLVVWNAPDTDPGFSTASSAELVEMTTWPDDVLVESVSREDEMRRHVTIRRDLAAHVEAAFTTLPPRQWLTEHRSALLSEAWLENGSVTERIAGTTISLETRANLEGLARIPSIGAFLLTGRPIGLPF